MTRSRNGTVLIIVAGIATLMLSVSVAFLVRMRADGEESSYVIHDSSARIMLVNALAYVCESSRLGWGEETFGWNDVHDHTLGPSRFVDIDGDGFPEVDPIWRAGEWPAPGSAARCPMYVMERPPRAIAQDLGFNPIVIVDAAQSIPEAGYQDGPGQNLVDAGGATIDTLGRSRMADYSMLDPRPVAAATWDQFETGDTLARVESLGLGWFRVYRETEADHDGDRSPWYDTIDLNGGSHADGTAYSTGNGSVFVITAGSGATQGYRFWSLPVGDPRRAVEPVTAEESGLFQTRDQFETLRAEERVLWFRVEWSPLVGDQSGKNTYHDNQVYQHQNHWVEGGDIWGHDIVRSQFGSIRWIQRLDREPEQW